MHVTRPALEVDIRDAPAGDAGTRETSECCERNDHAQGGMVEPCGGIIQMLLLPRC